MDCALCSKSINKLTDTFVTFSRCSDSDSGCEHFSHLLCTHLAETYVCPICNDGKEEVSFGLKQSDASFSAYKAMKREVEKSSGVFSAWSGANAIKQTLSKYPEETLKANTLLQLLSANIKLADLKECKAESLVKKFDTSELLELSPNAADLSQLLAAGAVFDATTIAAICPTAADLIALKLASSEYVERGFGLDQFISRGASLKQLLDLEDCDTSFSEFVGIWEPSASHLARLQAFNDDTLAETSWSSATVKSFAAAQQRRQAPQATVRAASFGEASEVEMKKNIKFSF